jgi:organic hydroperoxide reductase OsmC/OhrA
MTARLHRYGVHLRWTGAGETGTTGYAAYSRDHVISAPGKPDLPGSSDPLFRGNPTRWSPEELLLLAYEDQPEGLMREQADGAGQFDRVTLRPCVTICAASDAAHAQSLHAAAASMCFIRRSMAFPVLHEATLRIA